eukprot:15469977-Alexandrium_andersonii.AAC.1
MRQRRQPLRASSRGSTAGQGMAARTLRLVTANVTAWSSGTVILAGNADQYVADFVSAARDQAPPGPGRGCRTVVQ